MDQSYNDKIKSDSPEKPVHINSDTDLKSPPRQNTKYSSTPPNTGNQLVETLLTYGSIALVCITFPFSLAFVFKLVPQYQRAAIFRNGRLLKHHSYGPGLVFFLPCVDEMVPVDLRIISCEVPAQEALTKDSLTISIDAALFYHVRDPVLALINVADYKEATEFLAATTLRYAIGANKLSDVIIKRVEISREVYAMMKKETELWGITVNLVEIKDISLPLQLQKAMAAEAESTRLANAKIIVAKSEIEAAKSLETATQILVENPMCMQLRYLQSLQTISSDKTHFIVFPFSTNQVKVTHPISKLTHPTLELTRTKSEHVQTKPELRHTKSGLRHPKSEPTLDPPKCQCQK